MDCRQVDRCLEANLDGRLSGFERVALRQHLRSCRACRAKVEAMSAFAASIEKTFAAADGPQWSRLTPPHVPPTLKEDPAPMPVRPPRPRVPPARRQGGWRTWHVVAGLAVCGMVVAALQLTDQPTAVVPVVDALSAEAARLAAGRSVDATPEGLAAAELWFADRGLEGVPLVALPPSVRLEGVFLDHLAEERAAGLALTGAYGPLSLYLTPVSEPARPGESRAEGQGLVALGAPFRGWQAVLVGSAGELLPDALNQLRQPMVEAPRATP
ncbi:MAG: zf-HC2 domain-containing protein [Pseudomonadota bacterium]